MKYDAGYESENIQLGYSLTQGLRAVTASDILYFVRTREAHIQSSRDILAVAVDGR